MAKVEPAERELALVGEEPVEGEEETESTEDFQTVQPEERQKSHEVCLELCDDIRDVLLQIQREITGLFNMPRLKAVEDRYRLMGIYRNMEKLHADIVAKK